MPPASLAAPVWVVAPHPDDESLGCGGLLAALSDLGVPTWALLLSDGAASHPGSPGWAGSRLVRRRLFEWHAALDLLGLPPERRVALGLPDGRLPLPGQPNGQRAVSAIRAALARAAPATVLLPWRRDPHPDHRAAHALMEQALGSWPSARRLEYAVWLPERGVADDRPRPGEALGWEVPLAGAAGRKEAAIRVHRSQLGLLIHDDPGGFVLPEEMIRRALVGPERLYEVLLAGGGSR